MKSKSLLLIVCFMLALGVLAACSDKSSGSPEKANGSAKVSMVYWPGPESDAMKKVVDEYNNGQGKKDKVNVEMVLLSRDGTYEKEATMMSSKSSEVDMYFTASYIIGQHAPSLDPLNNKLNLKDYLPSAVDSLTVDGKTLAIPMDVSNHFLFYRTDLIEKLLSDNAWKAKYEKVSEKVVGQKLSPKDPKDWNWDDFVATAAFFSQKENSNSPTKYGTALQLKNLIFNTMIWDDVLWGNGGSWLDENGNVTLTSDAAKKAMGIYHTIYKNQYTSPNSSVAEYAETQEALKSGNSAFALQWSAAYGELNDPKRSPNTAGKIGVAPIPGGKTHVHALAVGLNKYSKHKEAALKWMDYLTKEQALTTYAKNGGIPPLASVLEKLGTDNPVLPMISKHIDEYGYSVPILQQTQSILEALSKDLSGAWVGQGEIDQALKNAQDSVGSLLKK
ncbi:sugar ABC transporter substrate-binding protein [Neobacillus sp.]|uniref:ABC transporter substrate-binding protein n=1 Tax=Neobacillus sp. TaxID=2675273 RepID=UPI00289D6248|nr:sugar ABC transporter substrate-binding protein [Neobacillus sp.]